MGKLLLDNWVLQAIHSKQEYLQLNLSHIAIRGARTHNLKNIDLEIPRNQLVVITGLSGSGKSSLAFDTLYAEGQRRLRGKPTPVHLCAPVFAGDGQARCRLDRRAFARHQHRTKIDQPQPALDRGHSDRNSRLPAPAVARAGTPHCPDHHLPLQAQTVSQMVDATLALPAGRASCCWRRWPRERKGEFADVLAQMQALGYVRFRIDGQIVDAAGLPPLEKNDRHDIDVVIDRPESTARRPPAAGRKFRGGLAAGRWARPRSGDG